MYGSSIDALMESDEVDAIVPVLLQRSALTPEVAEAVIAAEQRARSGGVTKPLHVCWVAPRAADENRARLTAAGIPCWPAATATVLAATLARARTGSPQTAALAPVAPPAAAKAGEWLSADAAFSLLQGAGFPTAPWEMVHDPRAVAAAADRLGYPLVLKAERPGLVHKSEAGAVRVGLRDIAEAAQAFADFCERLGPGPALAQRQAAPGVEVVFGARRDPSFGLIVVAGLGGVWIEALNDAALRLAPIDAVEARTMLDELKGRKLLAGMRGAPPVDLEAFAGLIARLSQWFCAAPWLAEMDLNPIVARGDAFVVVDARMRVAAQEACA